MTIAGASVAGDRRRYGVTAAGSRNASRLGRIKERTGRRDLALCSWIWDAAIAAPRHANSPFTTAALTSAPLGKLWTAISGLYPPTPPFARASPISSGVSPRLHPIDARHAAGRKSPAYRFLRAALHAPTTHEFAARAHAFQAWRDGGEYGVCGRSGDKFRKVIAG